MFNVVITELSQCSVTLLKKTIFYDRFVDMDLVMVLILRKLYQESIVLNKFKENGFITHYNVIDAVASTWSMECLKT